MRRDGVPKLQEVPEKMFFCTAERCHLGTKAGPAQHRHDGDDAQLAKVMTRVAGAWIGNAIEGGQENLHAGVGSVNRYPAPESIAASDAFRPITTSVPNAIPLNRDTRAAEGAGGKGKRAMRLAKATKLAFSVEPKVRARLVEMPRAEGHELGHYLQKVPETHVLDAFGDDDALAENLRAKRAVIERVVATARALDAEGRFDEHFMLTAMKACAADGAFMALYQTAIGGKKKDAVRAQKTLNRQLGRLIRKSVGAQGLKTDRGTGARTQGMGENRSAYTLLTKNA